MTAVRAGLVSGDGVSIDMSIDDKTYDTAFAMHVLLPRREGEHEGRHHETEQQHAGEAARPTAAAGEAQRVQLVHRVGVVHRRTHE